MAGLRPAKGIKKEGGILIRSSFLSIELPSAAELLTLTSSANSVSMELQGKQKTLETETMKPTEFPEETGPPGTFLNPVITDQIMSQENGLWWMSISEVSECFPLTANVQAQVFGFASGLEKKNMGCNFLRRRTEQKDNDCPECFRTTFLLCVQLLRGSLVTLTLYSHHAGTAASQMFPLMLTLQQLKHTDFWWQGFST